MKESNPFNITKAVDYSDEEIFKYWVDIPGENGFVDLIKPNSPMPMVILGGKGSGKTHIMRFFSFNLQKIRYQESLIKNIQKEGYIGIFTRCGGLNSGRFSGSHQNQDAWKNIFSYYIELWLSQIVLAIVDEIIKTNYEFYRNSEQKACEQILQLFDKNSPDEALTFSELRKRIKALQRTVDFEVNNCAITGENISNLRILVSPGSFVFGIPKVLSQNFSFLSKIQFIYLVDEFENLLDYQQMYFNTLLRERESPVTFRVGARWYGYRTFRTYSAEEDLKEGSEYEKHVIDQILRDRSDDYVKFAANICKSRLEQVELLDSNEGSEDIRAFFDEFSLDSLYKNIEPKKDRIRKAIFGRVGAKIGSRVKNSELELVISNLRNEDDPVIERTNLFLFFRYWKKNKGLALLKCSEKVKIESLLYQNPKTRSKSEHFRILSKFKNDIIDQICRDYQEELPYSGFDKLVKMSVGIPRLLLIMLKHVYRWSDYNGEKPFRGGRISEQSQRKGLDDAIKWFLDDARISGQIGKKVSAAINRIGNLLHEIRFSDFPPECSLSSFSVGELDVVDDTQTILSFLEQYSYIIKVKKDGRDKNSPAYRPVFQVNGLIAKKWELSIHRRGVLPLNRKEILAIFKADDDIDFEQNKKARLEKYNTPFKADDEDLNVNGTLTLF